MKKTLPYILIIAASYLITAFIANDINPFEWDSTDRMLLVLIALFISALYIPIQLNQKD